MKNVNDVMKKENDFENVVYSRLMKFIEEMENEDNKETDEEEVKESCCNECSNECFENSSISCDCQVLDGTIIFNKEENKLPKKVYFFTSSGFEKKLDLSCDVAINKAKIFDAKYIDSKFIQVDEDCDIQNSFEGCKMENSDIYYSTTCHYQTAKEMYNTIGILELKSKEDGTKYLFIKTKPKAFTESDIIKDQITEMEEYLSLIYEKSFSKDFHLVKNYIASESIEMELYPNTQPCILSGIQVIN